MLKCSSLFSTDMSELGQNEEADSRREAARRQWFERLPSYLCLSFFGSIVLPGLSHFNYIHVFIANQIVCMIVYVMTEKAEASSVYTLFQSILFLMAYKMKDYRYLQCVTTYLLYKNFQRYHIASVPPPIGSFAIPIMFEAFAYFGILEEGDDNILVLILFLIFLLGALFPPILYMIFLSYSCLWQILLNLIVMLPFLLGLYLIENAGKLTPIYVFGSLVITIPIFYMHESITRRCNFLRKTHGQCL